VPSGSRHCSAGLLGDAIHNLSDVATSALIFLGFFISKRPRTAAQPYGFERAEDIAGLGVVLVIWASARSPAWRATASSCRTARPRTRAGPSSVPVSASWATRPWRGTGFAVTAFILHVGYEVPRDVLHQPMDGVEPGRSLHLELHPSLRGEPSLSDTQRICERIRAAVLAKVAPATSGPWSPTREVDRHSPMLLTRLSWRSGRPNRSRHGGMGVDQNKGSHVIQNTAPL